MLFWADITRYAHDTEDTNRRGNSMTWQHPDDPELAYTGIPWRYIRPVLDHQNKVILL